MTVRTRWAGLAATAIAFVGCEQILGLDAYQEVPDQGGTGGGQGGAPGKPDGEPCADGQECESTLCVDDVCCAVECTATCSSCATQAGVGSCTAIPRWTDPDGDCAVSGQACNGGGTCQDLTSVWDQWPSARDPLVAVRQNNTFFVGRLAETTTFGVDPLGDANDLYILQFATDSGNYVGHAGILGGVVTEVGAATIKSATLLVAGTVAGPGSFDFAGQTYTLPSSNQHAFVAAWTMALEPLWLTLFDQGTEHAASAVLHGSAGVVWVAGRASGGVGVGAGPCEFPGATGEKEVFVAKLQETDGVCVALGRYASASDHRVDGLAGGPAGGLVLVGGYLGEGLDFGGGPLPAPEGDNWDAFLVEMSNDLVFVSQTTVAGPGDDVLTGVLAEESAGAAWVVGVFEGDHASIAGQAVQGAGSRNLFLAKVTGGKYEFHRSFPNDGPVVGEEPSVHMTGSQDGLFLSGAFAGTTDFGLGPVGEPGGDSVFAALLDPAEVEVLAAAAFPSTGPRPSIRLGVDPSEFPLEVILVGSFEGGLSLPGGDLSPIGSSLTAFAGKLLR